MAGNNANVLYSSDEDIPAPRPAVVRAVEEPNIAAEAATAMAGVVAGDAPDGAAPSGKKVKRKQARLPNLKLDETVYAANNTPRI